MDIDKKLSVTYEAMYHDSVKESEEYRKKYFELLTKWVKLTSAIKLGLED